MRRALLLLMMVSSLTLPIRAEMPRVRPLSDRMSDLVQEAARRSPTIAALLKQIEVSDIILQVDFRLDDAVPRAVTFLIGSTGTTRYVRTVINPRMSPRRRIELLGHELQHVVEIASDPAIRDQTTMRDRFQAIGWRDGQTLAFETPAAIAVEQQVRLELRSS